MIKRIHLTRISLLLLGCLLFFSTISTSILMNTPKAEAASVYEDGINEYRAMSAYKTLLACANGYVNQTLNKADYGTAGAFDSSFARSSVTVNVGKVIEPDDGQIGCDDDADLALIVKQTGLFNDLNDFNALAYPTANCANDCDFIDKNNLPNTPNLDKALQDRVKQKGLAGPDLDPTKLSPASQYALWNQIVTSAASVGGCGAKFTNDKTQWDAAPAGKRTGLGNGGVDVVGNDGVVVHYEYAVFDFDGQLKSDRIGLWGTGIPSDGGIPCQTAIANMSNNAKAFAARYVSKKADCVGKTTPECQGTQGGIGSTQNGGTNQQTEFEIMCSQGGLSWIFCPVIVLIKKAVDAIDSQVTSLLTIDTTKYFGDNATGNGFKQVWQNIRNISVSLLLVIGLIMIISTAVGTGPFDAYTVKRIMPRMLASVIIILMSWPLVIFAIDVSNSLGFSIRNLIQQPFIGAFQTGIQIDGAQLALGSIGVAGLSFSLGLFGMISFGITALLAVLIAFIVLVLRQILVILLAVIAPIAIVAYILPNTQKAGKTWWDVFSKALLTFPIIAGLIAIGRVFSVVSYNAGGGQNAGTVNGFISFIAYFAPYFALPLAFRFAGGLIGQLGGFLNDRGRGSFDRLKNFRKGQAQQNMQATREGRRFKGGNSENFRGRVNRGLKGATKVNELGMNPTRWSSKMSNALSDSTDANLEEEIKNSSFGVWSGDDAKLWAARMNTREQIGDQLALRDANRFGSGHEADRERAVEQILKTKREMSSDAFSRARIRAQAKTGTGYINADGAFDSSLMLTDINEAYGDDRNGAGKALAEMRSTLANSGQVAGLAGFGTWGQQMENMYNVRTRDQATRAQVAQVAHDTIMDDTINSVPPGQALYGKPSSAAAVGAAHARRIQALATGLASGQNTPEELSAAVANAAGIYDAMAQASPNNANAMAEHLMGVAIGPPIIDPSGRVVQSTIREYITSQMNQNPAFVNRRRDYSSGAWQEGQLARQAAAANAANAGNTGLPPAQPPGPMPQK